MKTCILLLVCGLIFHEPIGLLHAETQNSPWDLRRTMVQASRRVEKRTDADLKNYIRIARFHIARSTPRTPARLDRLREGKRRLRQGRVLEASDFFNQILEARPDDPSAAAGLRSVQKIILRLIKTSSFHSRRYYDAVRGIYLYNCRDWTGAAEALEPLIRSPGPLPDEFTKARLNHYARLARLQANKKPNETRPADDTPSADKNATPLELKISSQLEHGKSLLMKGKCPEAVDEILSVFSLDRSNKMAEIELQEALRCLQAQDGVILTSFPDPSVENIYQEGLIAYGNGRERQALDAFHGVLRVAPDHAGARRAIQRMESGLEESGGKSLDAVNER